MFISAKHNKYNTNNHFGKPSQFFFLIIDHTEIGRGGGYRHTYKNLVSNKGIYIPRFIYPVESEIGAVFVWPMAKKPAVLDVG